MQGSLLIFGGNLEERLQKISEVIGDLPICPDMQIIQPEEGKKNISIEQIREGMRNLQNKPFLLNKKYCVIKSAETLTTQAQNALLKTLEEPPAHAQIILVTKTESDLLSTVVSRCKRIRVKDNEKTTKKYTELLQKSLGERLDLAKELAEQENILEVLEEIIKEGREIMHENPLKQNQKNLELLINAKHEIEKTNVNKRLAIEDLMLNLQ